MGKDPLILNNSIQTLLKKQLLLITELCGWQCSRYHLAIYKNCKGCGFVKCYNHYSLNAVSTCQECGKGLCPECTNRFNSFCRNCVAGTINKKTGDVEKELGIFIGLFAGAFTFMLFFNSVGVPILKGDNFFPDLSKILFLSIVYAYQIAVIPIGWRLFSNKNTHYYFVPTIPYYLIRLILSIVIGVVIAPFVLIRLIKEYRTLRKNKQIVSSSL